VLLALRGLDSEEFSQCENVLTSGQNVS
jgi:hypothetical protein